MERKVFIEITNEMIYAEMKTGFEINKKQHEEIMEQLAKLNSKSNLNRWMAATSLTMVTSLLFMLIANII